MRNSAGTLAAGALGSMGIVLLVLVIMAVVMGYYERSAIEARASLLAPLEASRMQEGVTGGRVASQPHGSAVVPPSPNDQARLRHMRTTATDRLHAAAGQVLENQASLAATAKKNQYLAALYVNERSKAASQVMRRELLVMALLVTAGLMSTAIAW